MLGCVALHCIVLCYVVLHCVVLRCHAIFLAFILLYYIRSKRLLIGQIALIITESIALSAFSQIPVISIPKNA